MSSVKIDLVVKLALILSITLPALTSFAYYEPPWSKLCQARLTNKKNLYEVYHDCMDLCMLTSVEHRELPLRKRHKTCTFFTARLHNKQSKSINANRSLNTGLAFCTDQKIHRNGGHWLFVSRQCKRIVCEDKPEKVQKKHETCRTMNHHLNNGRLEEVYQKPTESDKQRKGTVPNELLKEGEETAPLETTPVETTSPK